MSGSSSGQSNPRCDAGWPVEYSMWSAASTCTLCYGQSIQGRPGADAVAVAGGHDGALPRAAVGAVCREERSAQHVADVASRDAAARACLAGPVHLVPRQIRCAAHTYRLEHPSRAGLKALPDVTRIHVCSVSSRFVTLRTSGPRLPKYGTLACSLYRSIYKYEDDWTCACS